MNIGIANSITSFNYPLSIDVIAALFANGEEGAWYDPSDSTTVFQDAAGTTAAGVGDPVGLILDKSKGLTLGSELEDTANTVAGWTLSGSNTVELDGDAIKITFVDNSVGASLTMTAAGALTTNLTAGKTYRFSADVKVSAGGSVNATIVSATTNPSTPVTNTAFETLSFYFVADGSNETFRPTSMGTGEVFWIKNISIKELPGNHATQTTSSARPVLQQSGATPVLSGTELVTNGTFDTASDWVLGAGWTISGGTANHAPGTAGGLDQTVAVTAGKWYRFAVDATASGGSWALELRGGTTTTVGSSLGSGSFTFTVQASTGNNLLRAYAGSGTDLTLDNISVQEVTSWSGGLRYLDFDGVDDSLSTASIDFTASDQMTTAAAVERQNSTAGAIAELSANWNSNTGTFLFFTGTGTNGVGNGFAAASRGTAAASGTQFAYTTAIYTPPARAVLVGLHDISDDYTKIRFDGTDSFVATGEKGLGNFSNNPIYFGARGGTTVLFDGLFFGVVIVNRSLNAGEISDLESWLAGKSGVTLSAGGGGDGGDGDKGG